jgi:hypothetical protein
VLIETLKQNLIPSYSILWVPFSFDLIKASHLLIDSIWVAGLVLTLERVKAVMLQAFVESLMILMLHLVYLETILHLFCLKA